MRKCFVIAALLLTGCTQTTANWTKAGATTADVEKAKAECKFEAAKSDVSVMKTTWDSELRQMSLIDMCLRAKGFTQ